MIMMIIADFEIQTDHLISARQPKLVIINNKNLSNSVFWCPGRPLNKIERKQKEK